MLMRGSIADELVLPELPESLDRRPAVSADSRSNAPVGSERFDMLPQMLAEARHDSNIPEITAMNGRGMPRDYLCVDREG